MYLTLDLAIEGIPMDLCPKKMRIALEVYELGASLWQ